MDTTESIGKRIRRLRKEAGMTQEELAQAVGVSPQAVSKWENEYTCPDISILPVLAEVFGISTDELLGKEPGATATAEVTERTEAKEYTQKKKKKTRKYRLGFDFGGVSLGKIWGGIFIIVIGAMLILKNATNIIPWGFWDIVWPSSIICFGMMGICEHPKAFNISVTAFGVYLLLCNIDVIPENFSGKWFIIGVFFIAWGLSAVFSKGLKIRKIRINRGKGAARELRCENGYIHYDGSFSSDHVIFDGNVLHGGSVDTMFGSFIIDFSDIAMVGEGASLSTDIAFASLTLLIPRTVRVTETRDTAFGSVNIKGRPYDDAPYCLNITSDVSFGSLDIKYV